MIAPRWRLALFGKGLLLLGIAAGFGFLAFTAVTAPDRALAARLIGVLLGAPLALFLGWAASLGLADAVVGRALTEPGAQVLKNRRQGYSMRVPSGRFVEFILFNSWEPLREGVAYTVTFGRFSGVIVARPQADDP